MAFDLIRKQVVQMAMTIIYSCGLRVSGTWQPVTIYPKKPDTHLILYIGWEIEKMEILIGHRYQFLFFQK